jgi:undecaprenyl-diphosphatase
MYGYLVAIIQGIVEGLTEFLPVSSTGHLILVGNLLSFTGEEAKSFEIFIQLGAILAVAWLYRRRLWDMAIRWRPARVGEQRLTLWHLGLAMAPAVVFGLLAYKPIKMYLFSPATVLIGLVVGGIYMIAAERLHPAITSNDVDSVTYWQALGIGLFQCLALWPGFSRSGATIAGGLLIGVGLRAAADFSFLLAVPVMAAATSLDLYKSWHALSASDAGVFAVGFVVSFLVAWAAVAAFLKFLERVKLSPFAWYRFAVAGAFGFYFFAR